jgi:nitroimidazol reductase NimA-like FMN-containing flavoprotein (pyridoxamine 5'-phosphate oxidase superfamily)
VKTGWKIEEGFDLDGFLARPLVARVAAGGPTIRPVWFLWEDGAFWWVTGEWSNLPKILDRDPNVALAIDSCDLGTGETLQVIVKGTAEVVPFDAERARRKFTRYLGPHEDRWDPELRKDTFETPTTRLVKVVPQTLRARDVSYKPSS